MAEIEFQMKYLDRTAANIVPKPAEVIEEPSGMEGLSDSDLKTLLQNFKDLSADEQHGLIAYLKKLEVKEPKRVEKLRQFVNLEVDEISKINTSERELSPFCNQYSEDVKKLDEPLAPSKREEPKPQKESDDDDDYTFDEVVKSAAGKVKEKQLQEEMEIIKKTLQNTSSETTAANTQSIISNLMVSLKQGSSVPTETPGTSNTPVDNNSASLAQVLSLLGNISGNPSIAVPPPPPPQEQNTIIKDNSHINQGQGQMIEMQHGNQFNNGNQNFSMESQYQQSNEQQLGYQNMQENKNNSNDNFGDSHQYNNDMDYSMGNQGNSSQRNNHMRNFPPQNSLNLQRGNQFSNNARNNFNNMNNSIFDDTYYQNNYEGNQNWNNPHPMMQNQFKDRQNLMMDDQEEFYNDPMQNYPPDHFRGQNRQFDDFRGQAGGNRALWPRGRRGPPPGWRGNYKNFS